MLRESSRTRSSKEERVLFCAGASCPIYRIEKILFSLLSGRAGDPIFVRSGFFEN